MHTHRFYPIDLTWTNNDDYGGITILRDGVSIASLDGDADSYTDLAGPAGTVRYQISAIGETDDCSRASFVCSTSVARYSICVEPDLDVPGTGFLVLTTLEWENEGLQAADGGGADQSPDVDDRVDILEVEVELSFTSTFVGQHDWQMGSPDGTSMQLWNSSGGLVEWDDEDFVRIAETGVPIPDLVPVDCDVDTCIYLAAGPGSLCDFAGEDAIGTWVMLGTSMTAGTLNDWCVSVFPDESCGIDCEVEFIRGDVDGNGTFAAILDALRLLNYGFNGAAEPPCLKSADADGNNTISVLLDALRILASAFADAPDPPSPYPDCAQDVDAHSPSLTCEESCP